MSKFKTDKTYGEYPIFTFLELDEPSLVVFDIDSGNRREYSKPAKYVGIIEYCNNRVLIHWGIDGEAVGQHRQFDLVKIPQAPKYIPFDKADEVPLGRPVRFNDGSRAIINYVTTDCKVGISSRLYSPAYLLQCGVFEDTGWPVGKLAK